MPEPTTMMAIAQMMQAAGQVGGLFGGDEQQGGQLVNFEAWAEALNRMRGQSDIAGGRTGQTFGAAFGGAQQALAGNLGLSPEIMQMMSNRMNRSLDPAFAQSRDVLRQSFNPRLAGSGAAGASMQNLLGQQAQGRALGQSGIQIQDAMARHQGQLAGLGQMGNLFGISQSALNQMLAQIAGQTRTQSTGFMG